MNKRSRHFYHFGPFSLDVAHQVLFQEGERVRLPPKTLATLTTLIEARGDIVSRDELMKKVWPDKVAFEKSNVAQHIKTLRRTLGDPKAYIETVPKRGYRFMSVVTESWPQEPGPHGTSVVEKVGGSTLALNLETDIRKMEPGGPAGLAPDNKLVSTGRHRVIWLVLGLMVACLISFLVFVSLARYLASSSLVNDRGVGRFLARSTSEGKQPIRVPLAQSPGEVVVTPDGRKLYAIERHGTAVSVLHAEPAACDENLLPVVNAYTGDGTMQDAVDTTSAVPRGHVDFAPGRVGQAFRLDGNGSYLWLDSMERVCNAATNGPSPCT